jgi:hypothetical protein
MKIVFKVIAIIGILSFLGGLKNGIFFFFGLILAGIFGYFGWRPEKKIIEQKHSSDDLQNLKTKLDSTIESLKDLKQKGILSDEEYKAKVEKIEIEKSEQKVKNSIGYKQLKGLFDSGVFTKDEFEEKTERLKNLELKSSKKHVELEQNSTENNRIKELKTNKAVSNSEIWIFMLKIIAAIIMIVTAIFWVVLSIKLAF